MRRGADARTPQTKADAVGGTPGRPGCGARPRQPLRSVPTAVLLFPLPLCESPELLLDFRLGGVAGVDVDPVEEAEGLSLG